MGLQQMGRKQQSFVVVGLGAFGSVVATELANSETGFWASIWMSGRSINMPMC